MRKTISCTLLITWVLLFLSCKTHFIPKNYELQNISVSEERNVLDSSIVSLYSPYKKLLQKDMERVISFSEVEMRKGKPESYLTNFLGDLMLEEGVKEAKKRNLNFIPAISFFNYGGIRAPLPQGEITVGQVFKLMPFENEMVFLKLSGKQLQQFLNYIAAKGGDSFAGGRFVIAKDKAVNVTIGGQIVEPRKMYWLVTNDYVANGGDGLEVLKGRKDFVKSGRKVRDLIISYMEEKQKKNQKLNVKLDGRIKYE